MTRQEYDRVEDAYVRAALGFLREAGVGSLTIENLENHKARELPFSETGLNLDEAADVIRQVLQEKF